LRRRLADQLLINYANERLQQLFVLDTVHEEQRVYAAEGVAFEPVAFFDNSPVIELISARRASVFAVLDDACAAPLSSLLASRHGGGHDAAAAAAADSEDEEADAGERDRDALSAALLDRLSSALRNPRFRASRQRGAGFHIEHFAGDVVYSTADLVEANRDAHRIDHDRLATAPAAVRTCPLLAEMFAGSRKAGAGAGAGAGGRRAHAGAVAGASARRAASASSLFAASMDTLLAELRASSLAYVRW
jgi:myosin heavy subunit